VGECRRVHDRNIRHAVTSGQSLAPTTANVTKLNIIDTSAVRTLPNAVSDDTRFSQSIVVSMSGGTGVLDYTLEPDVASNATGPAAIIAKPVATATAATVDGMRDFKQGTLSQLDVEAQMAIRNNNDAGLRSAAIRYTIIDMALPGTPQEVAIATGGGVVIQKVVGTIGGLLTRAAAESANFQFLTVDLGKVAGDAWNKIKWDISPNSTVAGGYSVPGAVDANGLSSAANVTGSYSQKAGTGYGSIAYTDWNGNPVSAGGVPETSNIVAYATNVGPNTAKIAPNAAASDLLNTQNSRLDTATHYCTDCALNLSRAAGGEGKVVVFSDANAQWPEKYNWGMGGNVRVPSAQGPLDFAYHSVYTDGRYFYDPLLSKTPIPQAQYLDMLKSLNPNGISWRTYNPNVQNPAVPTLQKRGF
jgi:hypothetical protein